jgi:hypothetical protein
LVLDNVVVRNFLYDYQSLIYVERNNFIVHDTEELLLNKKVKKKVVYQYGEPRADASIEINNSIFVDSSFDVGAIYFAQPRKLVDSLQDHGG